MGCNHECPSKNTTLHKHIICCDLATLGLGIVTFIHCTDPVQRYVTRIVDIGQMTPFSTSFSRTLDPGTVCTIYRFRINNVQQTVKAMTTHKSTKRVFKGILKTSAENPHCGKCRRQCCKIDGADLGGGTGAEFILIYYDTRQLGPLALY